jgi:hypothetical protein
MMILEKIFKVKKDKERGKRELVPQYCFSKKCLSVSKRLSYNINLVLKKEFMCHQFLNGAKLHLRSQYKYHLKLGNAYSKN